MTHEPIEAAEFEELYRSLAPEVHAYLRRRVGEPASDLLADVFVVAWERRGKLPSAHLRRAWLFGVARRLLLGHHRTRLRLVNAERQAAQVGTPQPANDERERAVRRALATLSATDRELIQLTEWERLTVAEAAVAVGLKPGAARVRLHRARQRLALDPGIQELLLGHPVDVSDRQDGRCSVLDCVQLGSKSCLGDTGLTAAPDGPPR